MGKKRALCYLFPFWILSNLNRWHDYLQSWPIKFSGSDCTPPKQSIQLMKDNFVTSIKFGRKKSESSDYLYIVGSPNVWGRPCTGKSDLRALETKSPYIQGVLMTIVKTIKKSFTCWGRPSASRVLRIWSSQHLSSLSLSPSLSLLPAVIAQGHPECSPDDQVNSHDFFNHSYNQFLPSISLSLALLPVEITQRHP